MARKRINIDETYEKVKKESEDKALLDTVDNIEPEKKTKTTSVVSNLVKEQKFTVNVEGYLRVRTGPGLDYSVEKQLPNGSEVKVTEIKGEWAKIGNGLWVMKKFLK